MTLMARRSRSRREFLQTCPTLASCVSCLAACAPPGRLTRLALDVGQALRHSPGPDPHQVYTADMPIRPAVQPPDDDPVTRAEHLLHLKMRGWRTGEKGPARLEHRLPPNVAGPVRCRAGGLKHDVVGDQVTQGVEVPGVECVVELLNGLACLVIHRHDLPLVTGALDLTSEPLVDHATRWRRGRVGHDSDP